MAKYNRSLATALSLLIFFGILSLNLSAAQAIDPIKIILPAVSDKSGYNSPEIISALFNKLRSQFRFPKYDILAGPALTLPVERRALERMVLEKSADGIANLEITRLRSYTRNSFLDDEIIEETNLALTLTYYDKRSGQYGRLTAERSVTELAGVFSGPVPHSLSALEELLNRLDKVFPRQFPGPRY